MPKTVTTSEWWERALKGERTPIRADQPQAGYYVSRQYRGGPKMPARIWFEGRTAYCMVAGERRDPTREWPYLAGHPIGADEYKRMTGQLGVIAGPTTEVRRISRHDLKPPF